MALVTAAAAWLIAVCLQPQIFWLDQMPPAHAAMIVGMLVLALIHDSLVIAALYKYLFLDR